MLIWRPSILILAICLALISDSAQSQRRAQQPRIIQPPATTEQPKATEEQRGTEQSPLIVKVVPTPKTDEDRAQEAADRERMADSDRKREQSDADLVRYTADLAKFTARLFYATIGLVFATIGLLAAAFLQSRDTKRVVSAAERSATIAERALTELEAPFVFVKINTPGLKVVQGPQGTQGKGVSWGPLQWCVINYGRTPASILEVFTEVRSVERDHDPPPIKPTEQQGIRLPYGVIAPPNGGQSHDFPDIAIGAFWQNPGALDNHSPLTRHFSSAS